MLGIGFSGPRVGSSRGVTIALLATTYVGRLIGLTLIVFVISEGAAAVSMIAQARREG